MYTYIRYPDWKDKALTFSYDDGVIYDARLIEIMQKYGLKGTFNLNAGMMTGGRRLDRRDAVALYADSGMEVAMHGYAHLRPSACTPSVVMNEFYRDKIELEDLFGRVMRGGAYAYGDVSESALTVLRELGVSYFRTTDSTRLFKTPSDWLRLPSTCHHGAGIAELFDRFTAPMPDRADQKDARLFYIWGHSYEFEDQGNWHIIEDFACRAAERTDIWHATNAEVFDYVTAYNSLIFSASGNAIYNPSALDVYLLTNGKNVLVKAGETARVPD